MTVDELIESLEKIKKRGAKGDTKIRLFDTYGEGYIETFQLVGIAKVGLPNGGGLYFEFNLRDIKK